MIRTGGGQLPDSDMPLACASNSTPYCWFDMYKLISEGQPVEHGPFVWNNVELSGFDLHDILLEVKNL